MNAKHEHGPRYGVLAALYGHHHQDGGAYPVEKGWSRVTIIALFHTLARLLQKFVLDWRFIAMTSDTEKACT